MKPEYRTVSRPWLAELERLAARMDEVEARIDALVARLLPGWSE